MVALSPLKACKPIPNRLIPVVVGGESPAAYCRAVKMAQGWYGFHLDVGETAQALATLRQARERYARPQELGDLEISITPTEPLTLEDVKRFADLGVHRLIVVPLHRMPRESRDESAIKDYVTRVGDTLIGRI